MCAPDTLFRDMLEPAESFVKSKFEKGEDLVLFKFTLDEKTFTLIVMPNRSYGMDSHARSLTGTHHGELKSLFYEASTEGIIHNTFFLATRGGKDAAYKPSSKGGLQVISSDHMKRQ